MMDAQTRFWIAQEVAETRYGADVRPLFQLAKQVAGKTPKTLVSDGAANFHEAYLEELYTSRLELSIYVTSVRPRFFQLRNEYNCDKERSSENGSGNVSPPNLHPRAEFQGFSDRDQTDHKKDKSRNEHGKPNLPSEVRSPKYETNLD